MYIVRYSTPNNIKLQIFIDRSFKTEAEAKAFIEKIKKSDEEQGLKRTIEYLGKEKYYGYAAKTQ